MTQEELQLARLTALFNEDSEFGLQWASIQIQAHQLLRRLKERGWSKEDRAAALQELFESTALQIALREPD